MAVPPSPQPTSLIVTLRSHLPCLVLVFLFCPRFSFPPSLSPSRSLRAIPPLEDTHIYGLFPEEAGCWVSRRSPIALSFLSHHPRAILREDKGFSVHTTLDLTPPSCKHYIFYFLHISRLKHFGHFCGPLLWFVAFLYIVFGSAHDGGLLPHSFLTHSSFLVRHLFFAIRVEEFPVSPFPSQARFLLSFPSRSSFPSPRRLRFSTSC